MMNAIRAIPRARSLGALARDTSGAAAIEFVLVAPLLLGLLLGGVTLFDMYRYAERTEATTFTLADILSREAFVDEQNLADLHATHLALLGGHAEDGRTRISSVVKKATKKCKGKSKGKGKGNNCKDKIELVAQWTYDSDKPGSCKAAKNLPLKLVPEIAVNDSVVIVETSSTKQLFTDSINDRKENVFSDTAVVRPRYVMALGLRNC